MTGFFLVALGGAIGAMLRYGVGLFARSLNADIGALYGTFFVNVFGSLLMGVFMAWIVARSANEAHHALYLLVAVGMLGGFTTFSTFSLEAVHFINNGASLKAGIYAVATATGSITALLVAFHLTKRMMA